MFDTVLVANRGEIAVRIIRTLRRLGVRAVAVYSDADADALHVLHADVAWRLGPAAPAESYLHVERILDAVAATGAQAVHPGYGFLAENATFAQACADAGTVFIGPSPHAMAVMGDKIRAKATVAAAGVAVVPGVGAAEMGDEALMAAAAEVGFPLMVKPSAGGGGKGMRLVAQASELPDALAGARREARSSFGDDTLFLERFVPRPRHIEVQVLADNYGDIVDLGERECSLQRRHQKVIEEAPSPLLSADSRRRIAAAARETARSVDYRGVGTVEFIVSSDAPEDFFFMEMNTRLQVEHPVTEMVTRVDLVELQLEVAAGQPLGIGRDALRFEGHSIEARIYAEDPAKQFLPTGGRVALLREASGEGVRVDSSLIEGAEVVTVYDPMVAKVIAWGSDRETALARLDVALATTLTFGLVTNVGFLRSLLAHPDVAAGDLDTELIERALPGLVARHPPDEAYAAYALHWLLQAWPSGPTVDPWDIPSGWRPDRAQPVVFSLLHQGSPGEADPVTVAITGTPQHAEVRLRGGAAQPASIAVVGDQVVMAFNGVSSVLHAATLGPATWIAIDGSTWVLNQSRPEGRGSGRRSIDVEVRSPMPGNVVALRVKSGDVVSIGQPLLVVEAMKMEHTLHAPGDGTVHMLIGLGDQVRVDQTLARVDPLPDAAPEV